MTYVLMAIALLVIVFISLLPAILIGKYLYKKDKDKEPKKLIIKLVIFGVLSVVPAIVLMKVYDTLFPNQETFITMLCGYVIGVGLIEEFSKFLPAYFVGIKSKYFDDIYDAIFYTALSALCFAGFENIYYVLTGGISTAILRFFAAVPGHACWGVIMGYFIGVAYQYKSNNNIKKFRLNMFYSLFVPALFHGLYDFGLVYGFDTLNLFTITISLLIDICFLVFAVKKIKNISNENKKISSNVVEDKNIGLKLILIGIVIIILMFGFSKINILGNLNMHTINEVVNVKEDLINIKVDSYEEVVIANDDYVKVNLIIENTSNSSNSLKLSNFKLMDNGGNYLEQEVINSNDKLKNTIGLNQKVIGSLYFKKNESINDKSKYALIYNSSKEYSIILAENIADFVE